MAETPIWAGEANEALAHSTRPRQEEEAGGGAVATGEVRVVVREAVGGRAAVDNPDWIWN